MSMEDAVIAAMNEDPALDSERMMREGDDEGEG